jgi:type IV secretion system protein VirB3
MAEEPEGYRVELFTALTQPILLGGVPRNSAILIWTMAFAAAFAIGGAFFWIGFLGGFVVQAIAAFLIKRDQYFFEILKRHLRQPAMWE